MFNDFFNPLFTCDDKQSPVVRILLRNTLLEWTDNLYLSFAFKNVRHYYAICIDHRKIQIYPYVFFQYIYRFLIVNDLKNHSNIALLRSSLVH